MVIDGSVKWFDVKKGYGFIVSPEVDGDIFVHYSKIEMDGFKKLEAGEPVEFSVVNSPDGKPQAESVIRKAPPADDYSSETQDAFDKKTRLTYYSYEGGTHLLGCSPKVAITSHPPPSLEEIGMVDKTYIDLQAIADLSDTDDYLVLVSKQDLRILVALSENLVIRHFNGENPVELEPYGDSAVRTKEDASVVNNLEELPSTNIEDLQSFLLRTDA